MTPTWSKLLAPLAIAAALATSGCSRAESAPLPPGAGAAMAGSHVPAGTRPRLVFFMNPSGRPCQLQDGVLRDMAAELGPRVDVVYYRTTEPAELQRFQQYGVRSLPLLVVTDGAGRELRRATPGIQAPDQIRQLLAF